MSEEKENKILFLDVDGVIATHRSFIAYGYEKYLFDPSCCYCILNMMLECGFTKIVLSSTWRYIPDGWEKFKEKLGIACPELVDYLYPDDDDKRMSVGDGYVEKSPSILGWLDKYEESENVVDFLILDDDSIIKHNYKPEYEYLADHFHKIVNGSEGFGASDWYRILKDFPRFFHKSLT